MSEASNSLVEISAEKLPLLKEKFLIKWPKHILAHNLIDSVLTRSADNQRFVKFYSLNSEWESDGTFVSIIRGRDVIFATLDPTQRNLKTALKLLLADKKLDPFFMCVRDSYHSIILEAINESGWKVWLDDGTVMKYLSKEDARKFDVEIPPNFKLRPLIKENAPKINSVWPHRSEGSVNFVEYMILHNKNLGLYSESDELVAWCLRLDFGSLATLQVDENHQRKGYGELITKAISKKIATECNVDITANIVLDNVKSLSMFQKLGFRDEDKNSWIGVQRPE